MKIVHAVIRKLRPRARHPDGVRRGPPEQVVLTGSSAFVAFRWLSKKANELKAERHGVEWSGRDEAEYQALTLAADELLNGIFPRSPSLRAHLQRESALQPTIFVRPRRS